MRSRSQCELSLNEERSNAFHMAHMSSEPIAANRLARPPDATQRIYLLRSTPEIRSPKLVLVVSSNNVNEFLKPVVVQVTSTVRIRTFPTVVELRPGEGGVNRVSFVLCHQVTTLDARFI